MMPCSLRDDACVRVMASCVRKSLREPTPSVAGIQQLGGFSILLSYMTTDILWLRGLAITGILAFNMIP